MCRSITWATGDGLGDGGWLGEGDGVGDGCGGWWSWHRWRRRDGCGPLEPVSNQSAVGVGDGSEVGEAMGDVLT